MSCKKVVNVLHLFVLCLILDFEIRVRVKKKFCYSGLNQLQVKEEEKYNEYTAGYFGVYERSA